MKQAIRKPVARLIKSALPSKVPADYSLAETGITQSLLTHFALCEQRFVFAVNRWVSQKRGTALLFGSLIHELLDKTYTLFDKKKVIADQLLIDMWTEQFFQEESTAGVPPNDIEFMKAKACVMLPNYIQYWKADFGSKKFEQIEKTDSVTFYISDPEALPVARDIFHLGKVCVIFRFKKDGLYLDKQRERWILESKCYGRMDEEAMAQTLVMDFQNLTYTLTEIERSQKEVKGVLRNILRNPGYKMNATDNLRTFSDRLNSEMKKKPEYFFVRFEVPYSHKDVETFRHNFFRLLCRLNAFILKNQSEKGGLPERNYCACDGKYICPYISACIAGNMAGYEQKEKLFSELEEKEV